MERNLSNVAIITDSCACIPPELIESLSIHITPYYIHWGKEVWRDLVSIQPIDFYEWLPTVQDLPTTACPGPGDYVNMYTQVIETGHVSEIVSIHMTSKGSGAYQAARTARKIVKENFPGIVIQIIDTLNVSMCHGWMCIEASRAALDGASADQIVSIIKRMIPKTIMLQTADTLKYLYLGGRIGQAKRLVGSLLNIKPIISMQDGIIVSLGQARSRKRAYHMMVDYIESVVGTLGRIKVAYVHAAALAEIQQLIEMVEARFDCAESLIAQLSPALGVHTGPGTTGLCFFPVDSC